MSSPLSEYASDLRLALELARGAGRIVLSKFGRVDRLTKTHAATTDEAVTEADRQSQRFIVEQLVARRSADGIIGEESDTGDSITFKCKDVLGRNWVIDPIDGTNNFIAGLGAFAVCIGLMDRGEAVLGVVLDVTRDETYAACRGGGAWLIDGILANEFEVELAPEEQLDLDDRLPGVRRLHVSDRPMSDSSLLMMTSNLLDKSDCCPPWAIRWIGQTNWKIRMLGSAAMEAVQVASGVAMGAVTVNGKIWDAVAPCAIVLEAGGRVSGLDGKPLFPFDLTGYFGQKVPFLAAGPAAFVELAGELVK